MSSPRKFSEKIALHNKKQAEETAAFEAILRDVSATTRAAQQEKLKQNQLLCQPAGAYRGGSLPNVNQISNNSIDLQNALSCLEDMKGPPTLSSGRQSLIDKLNRDRSRQQQQQQHQSPHTTERHSQQQQRLYPVQKHADGSSYSLAFLSPPTDASWRRTNSDSAIHCSSVGPLSQQALQLSPGAHRRCDPSSVEETGRYPDGLTGETGDRFNIRHSPVAWNSTGSESLLGRSMDGSWSMSQQQMVPLRHGRPCHVPGISVVPSPPTLLPTSRDGVMVNGGVRGANSGSLPDLSLRHPDLIASQYMVGGNGSLSPTVPHHSPHRRSTRGLQRSPGPYGGASGRQSSSPGRSREGRGSRGSAAPPSPLVLHGSCNQQQGPIMSHYRASPTLEGQPQSPSSPHSQQSGSPIQSPGLPSSNPASSPVNHTNSSTPSSPFPGSELYGLQHRQYSQASLLQLQFEQFNMDHSTNSPTHATYDLLLQQQQQQQQQQQLHLQQQAALGIHYDPPAVCTPTLRGGYFSQSSASPTNSVANSGPASPVSPYTGGSSFHYQPLISQGSLSAPMSHPFNNKLDLDTGTSSGKIPDIVLTDVDDAVRCGGMCDEDDADDFSSIELGLASGATDSFSAEDLFSEALRVGLNPLELEELQMLTDSNCLTDPITEDSFRLDER